MAETRCNKPHERRRVKLLAEFGRAKPGTIVEADMCSECGVRVASTHLGNNDEGSYIIPSKLAVIVD